MKRFLASLALTVMFVSGGYAQRSADEVRKDPKKTVAYWTLTTRKYDAEAELKGLRGTFAGKYESVVLKQFELSLLTRELDKMACVKQTQVHRLSADYAYLTLRRVALEVELHGLRRQTSSKHPYVVRVGAELASLERELESMLR